MMEGQPAAWSRFERPRPPRRPWLDRKPPMAPNLPQNLSSRFLSAQELNRSVPHRAWGPAEVFAEGQWQMLRASLESEGWSQSQIEQLHDQLRQGWPLELAKRNVAQLSGHCPLSARRSR